MELRISGFTKRSFSLVSVLHRDEDELVYNASGYSNAKPGAVKQDENSEFGQRVELFEEINELIAKMSKTNQNALYQCYQRLDSVFSNFGSMGLSAKLSGLNLDDMLSDIIADIFNIVKFEDLRNYIVTNRKIKLPPELSDQYITSDKITPLYMQRTYRRSEYIDLVAIALGLRLLIPVWGTYLPISGKEDRIIMKEFSGYKLLSKSSLYQEPAFGRLETYIRANLMESDYELAVAFKHLSSDEVPEYLMALALVRKVSVAPLSAETEKQHLMKIIYNYCCGNNNRMPTAFGANIKPKTDTEAPSDDNGSVLCIYKMKEQISAGDLIMSQIYLSRYKKAARAISPEIAEGLVDRCVLQTQTLDKFDPTPAQIALCLWVMSTVIAGCTIEMFDRKTLLLAMGIAQAVLVDWKLPQLAILITAEIIPLEEDELMPFTPRTPISDNNLALLDVIYPYPLPESKRSEHSNSNNPGVRGIEETATELFKNDWEPRCNPKLASSYYHSDKTRRIEVSPDIRNQIAELLIKLNEYNR